jgi:hypothetical protein
MMKRVLAEQYSSNVMVSKRRRRDQISNNNTRDPRQEQKDFGRRFEVCWRADM